MYFLDLPISWEVSSNVRNRKQDPSTSQAKSLRSQAQAMNSKCRGLPHTSTHLSSGRLTHKLPSCQQDRPRVSQLKNLQGVALGRAQATHSSLGCLGG